jgi:hypothetical protein
MIPKYWDGMDAEVAYTQIDTGTEVKNPLNLWVKTLDPT